jgi:hypothetical protein
VSYPDFSVWQRHAINGELRQRLVNYWSRQLANLAPLDLPSDHARPAVPSYRGGQLTFELAAASIEAFDHLCRSEATTLQVGLLALVALLLQRYGNSDDIAIAVPHWGRSHPDLEGAAHQGARHLPGCLRPPGAALRGGGESSSARA